MDNDVTMAAYKKLSPAEQRHIAEIAERFSVRRVKKCVDDGRRVPPFGEQSVLELLAALGVYLHNAEQRRQGAK